MAPSTPSASDARGLFGSGLRAWQLSAILVLALGVFLFWNGALWLAPTGASHVGRIAISYLMVPPLAALALALEERLTWVHFLSAVALLWSVKLVLTASLYAYFASGSASRYTPAQTWESAAPAPAPEADEYRPAAAPSALTDVAGVARERGAPIAGAVVIVESPPPGLPLEAAREVRLEIHGDRYAQSIYLASTRDRLLAINGDAALHLVRVTKDERALRHLPLPPGGAPSSIAPLSAGVYELSCENHPGERAVLVIVDHPYAAISDSAGRFSLRGVPAGERRFEIVRPAHAPLHRALTIAGARAELSLEVREDE